MAKEGTKITIGGSFTSTLFFIFLILKLTHVIDWSWWWITAPLLAPIVLFIVLGVIVMAFMILKAFWS